MWFLWLFLVFIVLIHPLMKHYICNRKLGLNTLHPETRKVNENKKCATSYVPNPCTKRTHFSPLDTFLSSSQQIERYEPGSGWQLKGRSKLGRRSFLSALVIWRNRGRNTCCTAGCRVLYFVLMLYILLCIGRRAYKPSVLRFELNVKTKRHHHLCINIYHCYSQLLYSFLFLSCKYSTVHVYFIYAFLVELRKKWIVYTRVQVCLYIYVHITIHFYQCWIIFYN